jgi:hypothetical protein
VVFVGDRRHRVEVGRDADLSVCSHSREGTGRRTTPR